MRDPFGRDNRPLDVQTSSTSLQREIEIDFRLTFGE